MLMVVKLEENSPGTTKAPTARIRNVGDQQYVAHCNCRGNVYTTLLGREPGIRLAI